MFVSPWAAILSSVQADASQVCVSVCLCVFVFLQVKSARNHDHATAHPHNANIVSFLSSVS